MTTVVLWSAAPGWSDADLLGRPVWRRTLDAVRGLGRLRWLGSPSTTGGEVESVSASQLGGLRDVVVIVPAEAPLLTRATLKRLTKRVGDRPRALVGVNGAVGPAALALSPSGLRRELAGRRPASFRALASTLAPEPVFPEREEELLRVETMESWAEAARHLRRRKLEALLRRGVVIRHPESVLVDPEVVVGKGAVLNPWIHLEGETRIGPSAVIGSFSHVVDSTIGSETVLLDHCFVRSSRVGRGAQIGPFAHLRPDSDVGARAKVGNFVELKKSRLGDDAKAPHLSYLGDATIGRGANVGAGTITCNYDGARKHQTIVGDGAFIGSDVQLVAPVRVGRGAYVAAGSCIVEDVPAHALALARSRQVVKRGWAKRRKK